MSNIQKIEKSIDKLKTKMAAYNLSDEWQEISADHPLCTWVNECVKKVYIKSYGVGGYILLGDIRTNFIPNMLKFKTYLYQYGYRPAEKHQPYLIQEDYPSDHPRRRGWIIPNGSVAPEYIDSSYLYYLHIRKGHEDNIINQCVNCFDFLSARDYVEEKLATETKKNKRKDKLFSMEEWKIISTNTYAVYEVTRMYRDGLATREGILNILKRLQTR
jgi:ribosome-associated translation inhibitor RaiA